VHRPLDEVIKFLIIGKSYDLAVPDKPTAVTNAGPSTLRLEPIRQAMPELATKLWIASLVASVEPLSTSISSYGMTVRILVQRSSASLSLAA